MRKFLKINSAAATVGVKDTLFALDDMLSIADGGSGAIDIVFKHPQGGSAGVTTVALGLTKGKKAVSVIEDLLKEFAGSKKLVIDAMDDFDFFYGEESAVAYTADAQNVGDEITFTVAGGVTGMTVEATLTDSAGVSLTSTSTLTGAAAPALVFNDLPVADGGAGELLSTGVGTMVANIKYADGRLAKTQTLGVTLA